MANRGRGGRTAEEWEAIGRAALLDLLEERFAVPWVEAEARISTSGWKDFAKVQPVQLSGARRALRAEGLIEEEISRHQPPVHLVRLPYPETGRKRLERLVGTRRKAYRKYLSWAGDQYLCGKHAEAVALASMREAAAKAAIFVPEQTIGAVGEIKDVAVPIGPLDAYAYALDLDPVSEVAVLAVEVKNVNVWIYPRAVELWSLLVKAAELSKNFPVVPILICVRYAYPTQLMASDLGFFVAAMRDQVFSTAINPDDFASIRDEFGLLMTQHDGPLEPVTNFFTGTLRRSPPLSEPRDEEIEWFRRQAERFAVIAPVIEAHAALAEDLDSDTRRRVFISFATNAIRACTWPTARGWS